MAAISFLLGMAIDRPAHGPVGHAVPARASSARSRAVQVPVRSLVSPVVAGRVPIAFSAPVAPMAPGDRQDIPIDLTDAHALAHLTSLSLWAAGAPSNALTDGTATSGGLVISLEQCSAPWRSSAACAGRRTVLLAPRFVAGMNRWATRVPIRGLATVASASGDVAHLLLRVSLEGSEVSVNGHVGGPSVQGLSTTLLFFFETP
jgi:hypothetical protein